MKILSKNIVYVSLVSLAMVLTACGDTATTSQVADVSVQESTTQTPDGTTRESEETVAESLEDTRDETEVDIAEDSTIKIEDEVQIEKASQERYAGWYMRIRASATAVDGTVFSHNSAGVFGQLLQSKDKKDRHDLASYGADVFQVVFPQYDWDEQSGDYWSDYREWKEDKKDARVVYTFLIRNQKDVNLSDASLELFIDAAQNVNYVEDENGNIKYIEKNKDAKKLNDFTLVDVDNRQTYAIDELKSINLSMNGKHTRTFRLVRGTVEGSDYNLVVKDQSRSTKKTFEKPRQNLVGDARVEWIEPDTSARTTKFGLPPE